ncbi:uncharacterized protein M6B38_121960 [Iris pallida]|uniref:Protein KAKU4-like n=1 Tax=Iris pallida TaxID=29817 RepID=A0AAX6H8B2_IRIPA|nr:uncharacterized protein M6B38_121960 [Iris pallida]
MSFFSGGRRSEGGGGSTWMYGIISGAGKVISSVFRSDDPSPSSSYSNSNSAEEESSDVSSRECEEHKQIEEKLEPVKDYNGRSLAIISEIESKQAIEQLIMQETFSREEFNHLTKIIHSRVVGEDGSHKELLDRPTGNAIAFAGAWKSFNQASEVQEKLSLSPSSLVAISPRFSGCRVLTPDLRHSAVSEAKKWLDDKKLATRSNVDYHHEPCTLNTGMPRYDIEGEVGSPVDIAKSYIQSLPPWKSLSSPGIEKSPHTTTHLYKDNDTANHYSPSSKGLKRRYLDIGPQDTLDEIRNIRSKASANVSDTSRFKLIDLSSTYPDREVCQISAAEECIYHDSRNLSALESLHASSRSSAELHAKDNQSVGAFTLPCETAEESNPAGLGSIISVNLIPDAEVVNAVQTIHATSSLITSSLRPDSAIASGPPAVIISDENQGEGERSQRKENFPIPSPVIVEHEVSGDHLENVTNSSQLLVSVDIRSAPSDVKAATNISEVNTTSRQISYSSQLVPSAEEVQSITDSEQRGNGQTEAEAEAGANRSGTFSIGSTAGLNTDLGVASKRKPKQTNWSKNEQTVVMSEGDHKLPLEISTDAPSLKKSNSSRGRPRGGKLKMSAKNVPPETQPSTSAQGRLTALRPRRVREK